jgi:hypothetical protein
MTAFMVYLEYSAAELQDRFGRVAIDDLVDGPELGVVRCVMSDASHLNLRPKLRTVSHILVGGRRRGARSMTRSGRHLRGNH